MLQFIESTWFLWWVFAVIVILRWFHVLSVGPELEGPPMQDRAHSEPTLAPGDQFLLGT